MDFRLNPVALVTGAASGAGAAIALGLAVRARGGLILVDRDEDQLSDTADAITTPPERVSTLACDVADAERWAQATAFVSAHYGRLDWAIVHLDANGGAPQQAMALTLTQSLSAVMRANAQGGAIVLAIGGGPVRLDLMLQLVRVANKEAETQGVRVCALLCDGAESALWRNDAAFDALVREAGGESAAMTRLAAMDPPLARCGGKRDPAQLAHLLLSNDAAAGVTLVVDASPAL
jgi:short chain dehydrogenase